MKNKMFTTMLVAVFAVFILADAASAYYSPRMGRFLNRDPIGETGALVVKAANATNPFIARDPIRPDADPNRYAALRNSPMNLVDPDGMAPTPMPPPGDGPPAAGTNCGIDVLQVPFCLCGGGNAGHTWLTWGGGGDEETADLPRNYIHGEHKCEAEDPSFINNKWHTVARSNGLLWRTQKKCSEATCDDIKACLRGYMDYQEARKAFHWYYNCRNFADDAINKCCLRKTDLQVNWNAPSVYCRSDCSKIKTLAH